MIMGCFCFVMQEFFFKLKIDKWTIVMFIEFSEHSGDEAAFVKLDINWSRK